jgi:hypothetical protein
MFPFFIWGFPVKIPLNMGSSGENCPKKTNPLVKPSIYLGIQHDPTLRFRLHSFAGSSQPRVAPHQAFGVPLKGWKASGNKGR